MGNGCTAYSSGIVAYHIGIMVARINSGLKYLYLFIGYLRAAQAAYQFFGFTAEHAATNYFYPSAATIAYMGFYKHISIKKCQAALAYLFVYIKNVPLCVLCI
jgi:hypothetical protein